MEEYYTQNMHCRNCGSKHKKKFEKGELCDGEHECVDCGCETAVATGPAEALVPKWG